MTLTIAVTGEDPSMTDGAPGVDDGRDGRGENDVGDFLRVC
jgi:hypothetical protein